MVYCKASYSIPQTPPTRTMTAKLNPGPVIVRCVNFHHQIQSKIELICYFQQLSVVCYTNHACHHYYLHDPGGFREFCRFKPVQHHPFSAIVNPSQLSRLCILYLQHKAPRSGFVSPTFNLRAGTKKLIVYVIILKMSS